MQKRTIPNVHLTLVSSNRKTGKIPVTTTSAESCPSACPFKKNGCYADGGPLGMHWLKVTKRQRGENWRLFLGKIAGLPDGQFWRHNQAGDLPGFDNNIDGNLLRQLTKANAGKRGFTYTHKPVLKNAKNRQLVQKANKAGFTVNLSANNLREADKLADLNIGPVVCVLPVDHTGNTETPKGRRVVQCPATIDGKDASCESCQLCQKQRSAIVGFPAHGASKRKAGEIAKG